MSGAVDTEQNTRFVGSKLYHDIEKLTILDKGDGAMWIPLASAFPSATTWTPSKRARDLAVDIAFGNTDENLETRQCQIRVKIGGEVKYVLKYLVACALEARVAMIASVILLSGIDVGLGVALKSFKDPDAPVFVFNCSNVQLREVQTDVYSVYGHSPAVGSYYPGTVPDTFALR
ncbi:hypothetical protein B0H12DRAFT_1068917 [Mycena haematopus]|nr:hypothetical protein B0H12DRAFT_1068917 [Mycena haematopus]